jgi:hypothetical protein
MAGHLLLNFPLNKNCTLETLMKPEKLGAKRAAGYAELCGKLLLVKALNSVLPHAECINTCKPLDEGSIARTL